MSSRSGRALTFLVLVLAVAVAYTAWETRNLTVSLDRMAVGNETNVTEMMISLARTDGQLARVRETVELLGRDGAEGTPRGADVAALEGKITAALTSVQREVLQQELNKWIRQLEDRREKSWAALRKGLEEKLGRGGAGSGDGDRRWAELKALVQQNRKSLTTGLKELGDGLPDPSGAIEKQGATLTNLEKRLAAVVKAAEQNRKTLAQRNERDEKRWQELLLELRESREATQQRYAELAARLDRSQGETGEPANAPAAGQQGQGSPQQQDEIMQRERLEEFCAEVPQSSLCRNL